MLRRGNFREAVSLTAGLDLEQGDQGSHLFLHGLQAHQRVQFGLHLRKWPGRPGPCARDITYQIVHAFRAGQPELIGQVANGFTQVIKRIAAGCHTSTVGQKWLEGPVYLSYIKRY
ncbi:hypothetical protein StoSoilB22_20050 [Arthrobacter sp. StoSoilB22]|nr:hypothetical protein StoSoilB22_20050 [Arthrobacter sp. StoSoilB22]